MNANSYFSIYKLQLQVRANTTIGKEIKLNENYIKDYSNCTVIGWGDTIEVRFTITFKCIDLKQSF